MKKRGRIRVNFVFSFCSCCYYGCFAHDQSANNTDLAKWPNDCTLSDPVHRYKPCVVSAFRLIAFCSLTDRSGSGGCFCCTSAARIPIARCRASAGHPCVAFAVCCCCSDAVLRRCLWSLVGEVGVVCCKMLPRAYIVLPKQRTANTGNWCIRMYTPVSSAPLHPAPVTVHPNMSL